jgi:hypothetical protein
MFSLELHLQVSRPAACGPAITHTYSGAKEFERRGLRYVATVQTPVPHNIHGTIRNGRLLNKTPVGVVTFSVPVVALSGTCALI